MKDDSPALHSPNVFGAGENDISWNWHTSGHASQLDAAVTQLQAKLSTTFPDSFFTISIINICYITCNSFLKCSVGHTIFPHRY